MDDEIECVIENENGNNVKKKNHREDSRNRFVRKQQKEFLTGICIIITIAIKNKSSV